MPSAFMASTIVDRVLHLRRVDFAVLVEEAAVDADQVDAVLGQQPGAARRELAGPSDRCGGPLTAQNRTGSPVCRVHELRPLSRR